LFTWEHNINQNTHTLKCWNEDYQYYSNHTQCGLMHGHNGQLPGGNRAKEPHTNLCMLYTAWFLMFKHWFCWKYQYKKYLCNIIDHLQFYFCECLYR
jgi:hypothetical protein